MHNYMLHVYKKDNRFKSGERFVAAYTYEHTEPKWMVEEVRDLRNSLYLRQDGWVLKVEVLQ